MDIQWKLGNSGTNDNQSELFFPKRVELYFGERRVVLSQGSLKRCVDFLREDFACTGEIYIHCLYTDDMRLGFHIFVHPETKTIFVPPGALNTNPNTFPGGGHLLQMILEKLAARNGYRLIVCISADKIGVFSDRVIEILQMQGYYLTYPIGDAENKLYGVHQSTHVGDGIPELGIPANELVPPRITYQ